MGFRKSFKSFIVHIINSVTYNYLFDNQPFSAQGGAGEGPVCCGVLKVYECPSVSHI